MPAAGVAPVQIRVSCVHVGVGKVCALLAVQVPIFDGVGGISETLPLVLAVGWLQVLDVPDQTGLPGGLPMHEVMSSPTS